MKKKIALLTICMFLLTGCGAKIPKLKNGEDAIVTFKDNSMISADDLYNKLKNEYALSTLINMVDTQILEKLYSNSIEDAKSQAEAQIKSIEAQFGEQAEEAIRTYTGYTSLEAYQNYLYLSYLQQEAIEDYAKSKVTDKEVNAYYKDKTKGDIKINHILITPNVTASSTEEEKKKAEDEAKATINSIIKELQGVKSSEVAKKFAELAEKHSQDTTTKNDGGSLGFFNYGTLGKSYDELLDSAYKLKDGEFSAKLITTELGYHVILRVEIKDKPDLDTVKEKIIETLAYEALSKDATMQITALQNLRKDHGFEIQDSEIQKQYAAYIQNSLAQAKKAQEEA